MIGDFSKSELGQMYGMGSSWFTCVEPQHAASVTLCYSLCSIYLFLMSDLFAFCRILQCQSVLWLLD